MALRLRENYGMDKTITSHAIWWCHVTESSARCFATILKWNVIKAAHCYSAEAFILIIFAGLILGYWRKNKTIAVILAYLRFVHHVSAGCVSILVCDTVVLSIICRLTWLKRKLAELGLKRRGQLETPLQQLVEAIKVFPFSSTVQNLPFLLRLSWKHPTAFWATELCGDYFILSTGILLKGGQIQCHSLCVLFILGVVRARRSTIMMLLAVMDPDGVKLRKKHCLRRRTYINKVNLWCVMVHALL